MPKWAGKCKNCRYWSEQNVQEHEDWGVCSLSLSQDGDANEKGTFAYAQNNGTGELSWLSTSPEFGCVQWERKSQIQDYIRNRRSITSKSIH